MVNGYSGFFPQSYFDLRELVTKQLPNQIVLDRLKAINVEFLVIDPTGYTPEVIERFNSCKKLEQVYQSSSGIEVYRIVESDRTKPNSASGFK